MNKLSHHLSELENLIDLSHEQNEKVSSSPVGWHIEHVLLATNRVIENTVASDPSQYKWNFNKTRALVFLINKIPRGKGKAPKASLPAGEINIERIKEMLDISKQKIKDIEGLGPNSYFEHPYFGKLNVKPTIKFLEIHLKHHLKIIAEIIKEK